MVNIGNEWDLVLKDLFESSVYASIRAFLKQEYSTKIIYPPMHDIFNAFKFTPYNNVKAVILGQDPYHGEGQAHGLCFSVKKGIKPEMYALSTLIFVVVLLLLALVNRPTKEEIKNKKSVPVRR